MDINWKQDYQGEFICPECNKLGMTLRGVTKPYNKRVFRCSQCKKVQQESCNINYEPIKDPTNEGVIWYRHHRIDGFICPDCKAMDMYIATGYESLLPGNKINGI